MNYLDICIYLCEKYKTFKTGNQLGFYTFVSLFQGLNGFDELRKYIKQGNEFCREVSAIMQERWVVL